MKKQRNYLDYLDLIRVHPLFHGFNEEEVLYLLDYLSAAVERIEAGNPINTADSQAVSPIQSGCILSGSAQHVKYDLWGKCSILDYIMPGYLFGCTHAFADVHYHNTSILTVKPCICLYLDLKKLDLRKEDGSPVLSRLGLNIIRILSERDYRLYRRLDMLARRTLREKILTYLSYVRDEHKSDSFDIPFNRQEMADYLYVERSSLSTELGKLRQEGWLEFHHNHFKIKRLT